MKALSVTALAICKHAVKLQFPSATIPFALDSAKIYNLPIDLAIWVLTSLSKYTLFFSNSITSLQAADATHGSKRRAQAVNGSFLIHPEEKQNLNATQPFVSVTLWLLERADWLKR